MARRFTTSDQSSGKISYKKNDLKVEKFQVSGGVHNDFSTFFFTRVLQLEPDKPILVPTFAYGKNHEVLVVTGKKK